MNIIKSIKENKKYLILGLFSGFINGLLGSGGGIIFVMGCTMLFKTKQKQAQATAIPTMLIFSIISGVLYILKGTAAEYNILIPVLIGSAVGGIFGATLLKKCSNKILRYAFAGMIIFSGVRMLCS